MLSLRELLKTLVYWVFVIVTSPIYMSFHVLAMVFDKDSLVVGYSQFLSLFPGQLGNYVRKASLRFIITDCDKDSLVSFGTLFSQQDTEIQAGVYLGPQCNIGRCRIEKNCLFGSGVHVMSGKQQHSFDDLDTPVKDQGGQFDKVVIGEDTWIGNGALIMANIGKKCIVGAGSVVIDDVEDYSIIAGNPAKFIKSRAPGR